MRILISSLQVSEGASKGHLHPAIEIGLALKSRGHHVGILPLPSRLSTADKEQVTRCQFDIIEPPSLPSGLPLPPDKLAAFARTQTTTHLAFESFLTAPLKHQFEGVIEKIKNFRPDVIVYDLLVYAPALASRLLGIPDIGYCAGLKLIAPSHQTTLYQSVYEKLAPSIYDFINKHHVEAEFHQLELLSRHYQLVFAPNEYVTNISVAIPPRTILAGALPTSTKRTEYDFDIKLDKPFAILCFGSVFDPADFPDITQQIINASQEHNLKLLISTRKPHLIKSSEYIITAAYLPLPQLLEKASIFIHHGGANTFSESLKTGTPQILIPLGTDQPIQAEILKKSQAGIALYPNEITDTNLRLAFEKLLDKNNPIHQHIKFTKDLYQNSNGALKMCELVEQLHKEQGYHAA